MASIDVEWAGEYHSADFIRRTSKDGLQLFMIRCRVAVVCSFGFDLLRRFESINIFWYNFSRIYEGQFLSARPV